ncbi:glutamate ABC transporter substrate-binding protein [Nocardioides sambongensis]|uniref:glutamate ABC transporter substrate-binding protein n=1 Tax=Nocardioides sambongensis TaxID=2589074 RepID=UPI00112910C6|nr:glutamate ABC transporter substrate-binding protein [Nocardioides sambongensis]
MSTRPRRLRTATATVVAALAASALVGCSYEPTAVPEPAAETTDAPAASEATCTTDESTLASYAPDDSGGATVQRIRDRGRIIVGVSADTFKMGSRNPETNKIEGFDIDIVRAVAQAIFGADFDGGASIQFRVITAADRIPLLVDGDVDMVVRNMTVNCERWEEIRFSQIYYEATQKVLIGKETADELEASGEEFAIADLAGQTVCAPEGSTSINNITEAEPDAEVAAAANHTGCLVDFQQGEVDAITGDDTVLAGLVAQDPLAVVPEQQPLTTEPYGVGVGPDAADLAAFVNAVLEDMRSDGRWQRSYRKWLAPYLAEDATQPQPVQPYRSR